MPRTLATAVVVALAATALSAEKQDGPSTECVRIGMVSSLFRDTPESVVRAMMQPFGALMESQTGIPGQLQAGGDAAHLGQLLAEGHVDIGVFHGIEFGWARRKYPEFRPLMIAVNQSRLLQALVLVRADADPTELSDLKGKTLALPRCTREHCHLFLERRCLECGQDFEHFFSAVTIPAN